MNKFFLQTFSDGAIYKFDDGSYSAETSAGVGRGKDIKEAIENLSKNISDSFTSVDKTSNKNTIDD